jgi:hypothetical protein
MEIYKFDMSKVLKKLCFIAYSYILKVTMPVPLKIATSYYVDS